MPVGEKLFEASIITCSPVLVLYGTIASAIGETINYFNGQIIIPLKYPVNLEIISADELLQFPLIIRSKGITVLQILSKVNIPFKRNAGIKKPIVDCPSNAWIIDKIFKI